MKPIFVSYTIITTERDMRYVVHSDDIAWRVSNQTIFKLAKEINLTELVKENLKYVNNEIY